MAALQPELKTRMEDDNLLTCWAVISVGGHLKKIWRRTASWRSTIAFDGQDKRPYEEAKSINGLFRSKTVAPPANADGMVRIVEILGLDRQACGGTHLASTGMARRVRILKVDSKGRQNRRLKVGILVR